jgi:hypothetical protein
MTRCFCIVLVTALTLGLFAAPGSADENGAASEQDSLSVLIDLLAEKGVITGQEQESLKGRVAEAERPAPPPPPEKPKYPTVKTKVRVETRFSSVQEDENQPYFGNRDDRAGSDGFSVRRARFYVMGDLRPETSYKLQYQSDWGHTNPNLHVAQMEWRGWDFADLIMGQMQTTFGFEIAYSDAYLLCTDRAAVSDFLPPDKDIGIMLKSKKPLPGDIGYELFVGNGSGKYLANPTDSGYLWIARLEANPTPQLAVAVALSSNTDTDFSPYQSRFLKKNGDPYGLLAAYTATEADEDSWEADLQWTNGRSSVWAEYIRTKIKPGDAPSVTADGYYLYLHQFLPYAGSTDKLEAVLGYQEFDPNTATRDGFDLTAYTLGLNYHITGSRYGEKRCQEVVRLNYVWNREAVNEVDNDKLVLQYQTWF